MFYKASQKGCLILFLVLNSLILSGCIGSTLWTGATLFYDRHSAYKKIDDFKLGANASRALFKDIVLKCRECVIDVAVFNRDLLLAGHVPTAALRREAQERVAALTGYRRIFNELSVSHTEDYMVQDSWITAQIRSEIVGDAAIDPKEFKIVTTDHIVYLMGDVIPAQAVKVIEIARKTVGVKRVVKLFKYYNLSDRPETQSH